MTTEIPTPTGSNARTPPPIPVMPRQLRAPGDILQEEYTPFSRPLTLWSVAEGTLKYPAQILHELHHGQTRRVIVLQLLLGILCLAAYGVTVGTFSLGDQLWLAPAKITVGVLLAALICLPSLFVFSCLAGADSEPGKILGALTGLITVASLLLLAFGPVSWIFSQSTESIVFMGAMNLVFWFIALAYGMQYIRKSMLLLNGRYGNHLVVWSIIFIVVSLQMTTTLRPILGTSDRALQPEKKFFLTHWGDQLDEASRAPRKR